MQIRLFALALSLSLMFVASFTGKLTAKSTHPIPRVKRLCLGAKISSRYESIRTIAVLSTALIYFATPIISGAVSGGGKDFATKDIRDQDFSSQTLVNKDFTQCG